MSTSVYQFIYIAPSLPFPVAVPKNLPQRRPILNGFTTLFSAYGVDPNGVSHQITSESLKWFLNGILITSTEQPISVGENTISALKKDGQVQVTSTSVGRAVPLVAEYEGFKGEVILTVEEPDFQSIYIAPPLAFPVAVPKNPPQVLPILKGFTTWFSAYGVDPKGVSHQITSESVNWSLNENPITSTKQPISVGGKTISAQEKDGQVQVTSSSVGMVVTLVAEYEGFTGVGTLTVEESDLLIYAPDGYVYRVPKDVWALKADSWVDKNPNPTNPPQPVPGVVARYNSGNLPAIQKQLAKAMEVANIPNPSGDKAGSGTSGNDNITCFLLNLNSILLNPGK